MLSKFSRKHYVTWFCKRTWPIAILLVVEICRYNNFFRGNKKYFSLFKMSMQKLLRNWGPAAMNTSTYKDFDWRSFGSVCNIQINILYAHSRTYIVCWRNERLPGNIHPSGPVMNRCVAVTQSLRAGDSNRLLWGSTSTTCEFCLPHSTDMTGLRAKG